MIGTVTTVLEVTGMMVIVTGIAALWGFAVGAATGLGPVGWCVGGIMWGAGALMVSFILDRMTAPTDESESAG